MPLVNSKEMFEKAYKGGYAIGAFNCNNMEIVQAITEAAKECNSPVILQVSAGARKYAKPVYLKKMVEAAVEDTNLPIVLHFDHGADFEICKDCIDGGFTSVMIDCSSKPFEENIAITRKVVEYAHAHVPYVTVEAELGTLAGIEDDVKVEHGAESYTKPEDVEEFVRRTGCDSLAIAIGTSHGAFKFKGEPKLDFKRLEEVKKLTNIPLVLHGASAIPDNVREDILKSGGDLKGSKGVPFEFLQEAIRGGINKINTDTDLRIAFIAEVRRIANEDKTQFDLRKFFVPAMEAVKKVIAERMHLLGSANKI